MKKVISDFLYPEELILNVVYMIKLESSSVLSRYR